jgi:hypothetical protein
VLPHSAKTLVSHRDRYLEMINRSSGAQCGGDISVASLVAFVEADSRLHTPRYPESSLI